MRPLRRTVVVGICLLVVGTLGGSLYRAWRYVPSFYAEAIEIDPQDVALASDELLKHASALASDAQKTGAWQALFTARQINGWLAVDLPRNHADLLPPELTNPRVSIQNGEMILACRYGDKRLSTVCTLKLGVSMVEPNTVAVRVGRVRAGLLPIPLKEILDGISEQAKIAGIPIEWKQVDGDPVAIIRLPPIEDDNTLFYVRTVELHDDELFLSGKTEAANVAGKGSDTKPNDTVTWRKLLDSADGLRK